MHTYIYGLLIILLHDHIELTQIRLKITSKMFPFEFVKCLAGLGIYDTMQYITAPIATWCREFKI